VLSAAANASLSAAADEPSSTAPAAASFKKSLRLFIVSLPFILRPFYGCVF
jgi:hypothetical protein